MHVESTKKFPSALVSNRLERLAITCGLHAEIILKAAVEREKAVQEIDVHRECKNCVVTFWVMSQFLHFLGASRGCADFRDPTAVFRIIQAKENIVLFFVAHAS
jgi:hypothetical protein